MKLIKADVQFNVNKKKYTQKVKFSIIHNLPNRPGMRFEDAVENWCARTKDFSPESLCAYIMDKFSSADDYFALTEQQYNEYINENKSNPDRSGTQKDQGSTD
jgi:hypothetical protein